MRHTAPALPAVASFTAWRVRMRKSGLAALFMVPLLPLLVLAAYNPLQAAPQAGRAAEQSPWPATPARRPPLGAEWIQAHYTKQEVMIAMRDGVKLLTAIYSPRDTSHFYPVLMTRTPYSVRPYGADQYPASLGPAPEFAEEGFIFVYQDVRGCFMSEGEFVNMRPVKESYRGASDIDETTDTYDTVEWLVTHVANNNGKVGQYGISYPGFYSAVGMVHAHPALVAVSPQAPVTDWFAQDDFHHNGALWLPHCFGFFAGFGHPRPQPKETGGRPATPLDYGTSDGYQFYLSMEPLPNADKNYFRGDVPFLERGHGPRHQGCVVAGPEPLAASQGHQARRPDGGRVVRRAESLRRRPGLLSRPAGQPGYGQSPGNGALVSRRLGRHDRRERRRDPVRPAHR
jgi:hypothetical protein